MKLVIDTLCTYHFEDDDGNVIDKKQIQMNIPEKDFKREGHGSLEIEIKVDFYELCDELQMLDFVNSVDYNLEDKCFEIYCTGIEDVHEEHDAYDSDCNINIVPYKVCLFDGGQLLVLPTDGLNCGFHSVHPNISSDGDVCWGGSFGIIDDYVESGDIIMFMLSLRDFMSKWSAENPYYNPVSVNPCDQCTYTRCFELLCCCRDCADFDSFTCVECNRRATVDIPWAKSEIHGIEERYEGQLDDILNDFNCTDGVICHDAYNEIVVFDAIIMSIVDWLVDINENEVELHNDVRNLMDTLELI